MGQWHKSIKCKSRKPQSAFVKRKVDKHAGGKINYPILEGEERLIRWRLERRKIGQEVKGGKPFPFPSSPPLTEAE